MTKKSALHKKIQNLLRESREKGLSCENLFIVCEAKEIKEFEEHGGFSGLDFGSKVMGVTLKNGYGENK